MAFQAKLFINDEERNVLNSAFLYQQLVDSNGRPKSSIQGGNINLMVASTKNDELFYDWMFSTHIMNNGYVRFYKRDGYSKLFDFEFGNCHCIHLEEKFNAVSNDPLKIELILSPGIQRVRGVLFEKNWNPSNPFDNATPITERAEEDKPEIVDFYIETNGEDSNTKYKVGDTISVVIISKNKIGDLVDIDLKDKTKDFKYNGEIVLNDIIKDFEIRSNKEVLKLEVIENQEN